jgi:ADP-heptose:LPS heptosyltransferase
LVIGAAHATKRLPTEQLIALCRQLPQVAVVLLGGPEDKDTGAHIAQVAGAHVINACGGFRLHQSADLVRQSAVVVTHDTGLMHIAAALHRPIVTIWGNTVPELGMYPYLPSGAPAYRGFEVAGLPCRPCSKIGHAACPRGHFDCMAQQDIPQIAQVAWERVVADGLTV